MALFPIIGLLLWIAFLFAVVVLCGVAWVLGSSVLGVLELVGRHGKRSRQAVGRPPRQAPPAPVNSRPRTAPSPTRRTPSTAATAPPAQSHSNSQSDIWPKWTPSHRLYKDYELALWQEQFDALNSRG
ncbi:hypothetical protein [Arthrobacter sp. AD-310]